MSVGRSGVGLGGQSGCKRRIEIFVKIQKKNGGGRGVGGGGSEMGQGGRERRIEVFCENSKKKIFFLGGGVGGEGSGWGGGGVRVM